MCLWIKNTNQKISCFKSTLLIALIYILSLFLFRSTKSPQKKKDNKMAFSHLISKMFSTLWFLAFLYASYGSANKDDLSVKHTSQIIKTPQGEMETRQWDIHFEINSNKKHLYCGNFMTLGDETTEIEEKMTQLFKEIYRSMDALPLKAMIETRFSFDWIHMNLSLHGMFRDDTMEIIKISLPPFVYDLFQELKEQEIRFSKLQSILHSYFSMVRDARDLRVMPRLNLYNYQSDSLNITYSQGQLIIKTQLPLLQTVVLKKFEKEFLESDWREKETLKKPFETLIRTFFRYQFKGMHYLISNSWIRLCGGYMPLPSTTKIQPPSPWSEPMNYTLPFGPYRLLTFDQATVRPLFYRNLTIELPLKAKDQDFNCQFNARPPAEALAAVEDALESKLNDLIYFFSSSPTRDIQYPFTLAYVKFISNPLLFIPTSLLYALPLNFSSPLYLNVIEAHRRAIKEAYGGMYHFIETLTTKDFFYTIKDPQVQWFGEGYLNVMYESPLQFKDNESIFSSSISDESLKARFYITFPYLFPKEYFEMLQTQLKSTSSVSLKQVTQLYEFSNAYHEFTQTFFNYLSYKKYLELCDRLAQNQGAPPLNLNKISKFEDFDFWSDFFLPK